MKNLSLKQQEDATRQQNDFDKQIEEIEGKYDKYVEEMYQRKEAEIREIKEKKSEETNTLMKQHKKALSDVKKHYHDVTVIHLAFITPLKVKGRLRTSGGNGGVKSNLQERLRRTLTVRGVGGSWGKVPSTQKNPLDKGEAEGLS